MNKTKMNKIVLLKITFLFVFLYTLGVIPAFAQPPAERTTVSADSENRGSPPINKTNAFEDMWVCPVFESGWYSISNIAIGGGAALGYGNRAAIGLKVIYWNDMDGIRSLELNFLLRFYIFGRMERSGLFAQVNGGPVIFARDEGNLAVPSGIGTFSAGFSVGWRFLFGRYFFVEPAVRAGYPYIAGAGLSAGVRF
jgi:hypothetical protein